MKRLAVFILVIFFTSCETDIVLNIPPQPQKLVVTGLVQVGTPFRVTITKTTGVLDTLSMQRNRVTNAFVQLHENNVVVDTLVFNASDDAYTPKRNTQPTAGKTYTIRAVADGFAAVEATTFTPNYVPIQSVTRRTNVKKDANGEFVDEVKITFTDEAVLNHYMLRIGRLYFVGQSIIGYNGIYCMQSSDRDIEGRSSGEAIEFESCIDHEFFLRDVNFNGKTKEVVLFIRNSELQPYSDPSTNRTVTPVVELHNITADQFKYRISLAAYNEAEDNPFAEPVLLYTNVKNGYGLFATYSMAREPIR